MTKKATQLSGAQQERTATLAYVRRLRKCYEPEELTANVLLNVIEKWLLSRKKRYDARPGGLGKKPKKVKKDFDALGIP